MLCCHLSARPVSRVRSEPPISWPAWWSHVLVLAGTCSCTETGLLQCCKAWLLCAGMQLAWTPALPFSLRWCPSCAYPARRSSAPSSAQLCCKPAAACLRPALCAARHPSARRCATPSTGAPRCRPSGACTRLPRPQSPPDTKQRCCTRCSRCASGLSCRCLPGAIIS